MGKLIMALLILLIPTLAFSAGSVTSEDRRISAEYRVIVMTWIGDASDGSVPNTDTLESINGCVALVVTDPGSTAPTDNYDIVLNDDFGVDIMGGELANRDTANTEQVVPKMDAVYGCRPVYGKLQLQITNQSVSSGNGVVYIHVYED